MLKHSLQGLRAAMRQPKLTVLLWAWNLLLGLTLVWPLWRWWGEAVRYAPAADPMLYGFQMDVFKELLHADRTPVFGIVTSLVAAAMGLTLVLNAAMAGGTLETLLMTGAIEPRGFLRQFFRGAGHFFLRFAGLLLLTLAGGAGAVLLVVLVVSLSVSGLDDGGWEPAWVIQAAVVGASAALTIVFFAIALDYARIRTAVEDRRGILRTWFGSLWLVLRHPLRTFGIWTIFAIVLLALVVAYTFARNALPATSWAAILAMAALQQVFMLARTGLRVATIAGAIDAYRHLQPVEDRPIVVPPAPAPWIDAAPAGTLPFQFDEHDADAPPLREHPPRPLDDLALEPRPPQERTPPDEKE